MWSHTGLFIALMLVTTANCKPPRHVVFVHNQEKNSIKAHDLPVRYDDWKQQQPPPGWIVDVSYHDLIEKTGWAVGEFTLNPDQDRELLAYGAGYAEGYMTFDRIGQHWNNTLKGFCDDPKMTPSCKKIHDFLQQNLDWMKNMIKKFPKDPYWMELNKVLLQVQGLVDGYNKEEFWNPTIRLKPFGFLLFQLDGDMADLEDALNVTDKFFRRRLGEGSCSALVKITEDHQTGKKDLLTSHATWVDYNMMLRIVKRFNFPTHTETFSGYPGPIFSGDDFNILSSGLVATSTTNGNTNSKLWDFVTTETNLEWIRCIVAHRLAKNGEQWCNIFEQHNSGTYNNQWMIVDYKAFEDQKTTGILHVLEQIPGQIVYKDLTNVLMSQTYWASYNIPYFSTIFSDSGFPEKVKKYGDWFTHDKSPRAKIFARDHKKVTDMDSLIKLMRYNDFKNDPLSKCNCTPPYSAENAIAARSDLNNEDGSYPFPTLGFGCRGATDMKATSATLRNSFGMMVECGPTHDQQPVFQWSKSQCAKKSHLGQPDKFDFKSELIVWDK